MKHKLQYCCALLAFALFACEDQTLPQESRDERLFNALTILCDAGQSDACASLERQVAERISNFDPRAGEHLRICRDMIINHTGWQPSGSLPRHNDLTTNDELGFAIYEWTRQGGVLMVNSSGASLRFEVTCTVGITRGLLDHSVLLESGAGNLFCHRENFSAVSCITA